MKVSSQVSDPIRRQYFCILSHIIIYLFSGLSRAKKLNSALFSFLMSHSFLQCASNTMNLDSISDLGFDIDPSFFLDFTW